jgi:hypothetical protein
MIAIYIQANAICDANKTSNFVNAKTFSNKQSKLESQTFRDPPSVRLSQPFADEYFMPT